MRKLITNYYMIIDRIKLHDGLRNIYIFFLPLQILGNHVGNYFKITALYAAGALSSASFSEVKTYYPISRYLAVMAQRKSMSIAEIVAITKPIFTTSKCDFAYLGGSVAEGTNGWWSDIDFFVHATWLNSKDSKSRSDWLNNLVFLIVKALKTDNVHVNFLADLPLNVQYSVISKGKVIHERDDGTIRADYIEWMLPRYYDFKTWYERMIDEWTYS
jgi:hypothetical protein